MGTSNNSVGVIRIGRKGIKRFAFGEDGTPFDVDVVVAFQRWIIVDEGFRQTTEDGREAVSTEDMPAYHQAAVAFATECAGGKDNGPTSVSEALDFVARLREQYDELADFFQPRRRVKEESPGTSAPALQFSVEEES